MGVVVGRVWGQHTMDWRKNTQSIVHIAWGHNESHSVNDCAVNQLVCLTHISIRKRAWRKHSAVICEGDAHSKRNRHASDMASFKALLSLKSCQSRREQSENVFSAMAVFSVPLCFSFFLLWFLMSSNSLQTEQFLMQRLSELCSVTSC